MIKKLSLPLILGILISLSSCESTGVCTEPVTPNLMIGFAEIDGLGNPENVSPPSNLKIYGNKDGIDIIGTTAETEYLYPSLSQADENKLIPLLFDVNRDTLTYILKFDGDIFDTLKINYIRENIYINKNCGYKTVFQQVELNYYSTNVIDSLILLSDNIEYDTEQHIKIFNK